jgi:hypothetical protein
VTSTQYEGLLDVPVPEELAKRGADKGWPESLLARMVSLRMDTGFIDFWLSDQGPGPEELEKSLLERERLTQGTLRCRPALRQDGAALSELFAASPETIGDWQVTVVRSPNAFAQFELQEHPAVVMIEDRAIPLATFAVGIKKAMVGGQPKSGSLSSLTAAASGAERSFLVILAVAQRRLVAMSSALISTLERFCPSGVSQERCSSRPVTVTRVPRARDSVAFSASSPQAITSKKLVDSSQVLSSRLSQRRFTAIPKLVIA